jgi:hypothetical protein
MSIRAASPDRRRRWEIPNSMTAARAAVLVGVIGLAGLFASCVDWVSLGPLVECGRRCKPPRGSACEGSVAQYNRIGECICGEVTNCPGYVCEPSPPLDYCFIAHTIKKASASARSRSSRTPAASRARPREAELPGHRMRRNRFEYDGAGDCVCAPAVCPCGQPCVPLEGSTCPPPPPIQRVRPVRLRRRLRRLRRKPLLRQTCGEPCELHGCEDGESCVGQCDKTNHCVSSQPDCDPIPK